MDTPKFTPQHRSHLTEARILRGWSQQEVADRIGSTYVNISRWERGITRPNPYFRRKLCTLFGKDEHELDLEESPPKTETPSTAPSSSQTSSNGLYDPAIPLLPPIPLVGRDNELTQLKRRLSSGGSVALTALNGLPGVGKTALSIALAHDSEVRVHFQDGVLWAGLGPHPNILGLLSRWGTLLGIPATEMTAFSSREAWARALRTAIGSRSMLLVIDDAWELEDALFFKVGGPNCAHLLTTRFPTIATYIALDGATAIQELNEDESMTLLKLLAPGIVDHEEKGAAALVHAVGGLPLALTLMGNYLRKQAYSRQARRTHAALLRLSDAEERLQISEPHGPVESHPSLPSDTPLSLHSVIAVTDQQLREQARTALYALSVFPPKPDTFSEEAALRVAQCTVDTLDALIDAGLLESSSSDHYMLHQSIADYARLHLQDNKALDRLITYAIEYVEAHTKDYEMLELESNVIVAALEAACELGKRVELVRAVRAFAPFLLLRGLYSLAELHLQRTCEAAIALNDQYSTTWVLLYLGEIAQKQGNYAQAESFYQEGLTLARQLADPERISALLTNLGWVTLKRGEYAQAEAYLQEGLLLARQIGHRERISGLLEMLGSVSGSRGDYIQSETYLREGLALAREIGDRERICTLLINLGVTAGEQGKYAQSEEYFQEGLLLARQIGHREWVTALLTNLGEAVDAQGNYPQAETYFEEGLVLARQIGHREWISVMLINLGLTALKQKHYTQAETYLQEGLTIARQIGIPRITANALYEYGILYLCQQQLKVAENVFNEILNMIPSGGQDMIALAQYGLARVAAAQGDIDEAQKLGELSVFTLKEMGHRTTKEVNEWLNTIKD